MDGRTDGRTEGQTGGQRKRENEVLANWGEAVLIVFAVFMNGCNL